ncbi:MAG: ECF-type sigma factor [Planctomycetota bacterium]
MSEELGGALTLILNRASEGDFDAADELFEIVYTELRKIAAAQMRNESSNLTLQSTALVHEVWLKFFGKQSSINWDSRKHFFAATAQAMRRILVDAARARGRKKRGGDFQKISLESVDGPSIDGDQIIALDDALELFSRNHSVKAKLVELRFFAGMTNAEASKQLGISTATAERYWVFAKAWLRNKMDD